MPTEKLILTTPPRMEELVLVFFQTYKPADVSRYLRQVVLQFVSKQLQEKDIEPVHPGMLLMFYDLFEMLDVVEEELSNVA